jgi:TPR repeat protein
VLALLACPLTSSAAPAAPVATAAPAAPSPAASAAAASAALAKSASAPRRSAFAEAQAQFDRALVALCRRRPVAASADDPARLLRSAADQGHLGAQSVLGWMLMGGHRVPRDDAQAAA